MLFLQHRDEYPLWVAGNLHPALGRLHEDYPRRREACHVVRYPPKEFSEETSLWADITIAWALLESTVFTMALAISSTLGGLDCGSTFEYSYLTESSFAKASISRLNCSAKACSSSSPSSTWVTITFEPEYSAR